MDPIFYREKNIKEMDPASAGLERENETMKRKNVCHKIIRIFLWSVYYCQVGLRLCYY